MIREGHHQRRDPESVVWRRRRRGYRPHRTEGGLTLEKDCLCKLGGHPDDLRQCGPDGRECSVGTTFNCKRNTQVRQRRGLDSG
jgi:hypothetical protein